VNQNRIYIVLTLVFIALSLGGLIFFYRPPVTTPTLLEQVTAKPTMVPQDSTPIAEVTDTPPLPPEATSAPSSPVDPSQPQPTDIPEPTPTPATYTLTSTQYNFSVPYTSSRKLYESAENGGTRYTLYSSSGNITVHAGSRWSWLHPGREFTSDFLVAGQPTFVYKISTQTLVDLEINGTKITVQCVHGGRQSAIDECQQFLSEFSQISGS
jgi:hypothetical protein